MSPKTIFILISLPMSLFTTRKSVKSSCWLNVIRIAWITPRTPWNTSSFLNPWNQVKLCLISWSLERKVLAGGTKSVWKQHNLTPMTLLRSSQIFLLHLLWHLNWLIQRNYRHLSKLNLHLILHISSQSSQNRELCLVSEEKALTFTFLSLQYSMARTRKESSLFRRLRCIGNLCINLGLIWWKGHCQSTFPLPMQIAQESHPRKDD